MLDTRRLTKADDSSWAITLTSKDEKRCFMFELVGGLVSRRRESKDGDRLLLLPHRTLQNHDITENWSIVELF
jgi:hypothetical protein